MGGRAYQRPRRSTTGTRTQLRSTRAITFNESAAPGLACRPPEVGLRLRCRTPADLGCTRQRGRRSSTAPRISLLRRLDQVWTRQADRASRRSRDAPSSPPTRAVWPMTPRPARSDRRRGAAVPSRSARVPSGTPSRAACSSAGHRGRQCARRRRAASPQTPAPRPR